MSIERDIVGLGFRLSYIGSRSRGLNYAVNINKPQPSLIPFTIPIGANSQDGPWSITTGANVSVVAFGRFG